MQRGNKEDPPGLLDRVQGYVDDPSNPLHDQLAPGEQILETFDVFYPEHRLPRWKLVYYSLISCGLYLLGYGLYRMYRACTSFFHRVGCCTPSTVHYERGKMAITNHGRAICWEQVVEQHKHARCCLMCIFKCCCPTLCGPGASYQVQTKFSHFALSDLCEITQAYDTTLLGGCMRYFCCCCAPSEAGVCLTFGGWDAFSPFQLHGAVQATHKHGVLMTISSYLATLAQTLMDRTTGWFNLTYPKIYVISSQHDDEYKDDHRDKFHQLNKLVAQATRLLPPREDRFFSEGQEPANFKTASELEGKQLVDDKGNVSIHPSLLELMDDERVIEAFGGLYTPTVLDWILSVVTLGVYYWFVVRKKRFERFACVLTNKRFIEYTICHERGVIPSSFSGFALGMRSFFPLEEGTSGVIKRSRRHAETGAVFGELGLYVSYTGAGLGSEAVVEKFITFAKALSMTTSRQRPLHIANQQAHAAIQDERVPLMAGESLVGHLDEKKPNWDSCCYNPVVGGYLCSHSNPFVCPFPAVPLILTCGFRPYKSKSELYVTDHTVFTLQHSRLVVPCLPDDHYVMVYTPVRYVIGTGLEISTAGNDTCLSRCFTGTAIGDHCCPVANARSNFSVHTADVAMSVFGTDKGDINFRADERFPAFRNQVSAVIAAAQAERQGNGTVHPFRERVTKEIPIVGAEPQAPDISIAKVV